MIITIDFDNTLTKRVVQNFVKEVQQLEPKIQIIILTSRLTDKTALALYGSEKGADWNNDIRELAVRLGIETVYYTNLEGKDRYCHALGADLHLDDDDVEIRAINAETTTLGLNICRSNWLIDAYKIINKRRGVIGE